MRGQEGAMRASGVGDGAIERESKVWDDVEVITAIDVKYIRR